MDNVSKKIDDLKKNDNIDYVTISLVESKRLLISYLSTYLRFIKDYEVKIDDYFRAGNLDSDEYCEYFHLILDAYSNYNHLSGCLCTSSIDLVNSSLKKALFYIKDFIIDFMEL